MDVYADPRYQDLMALSENLFDDMFQKYFYDTKGLKLKRTHLRSPISTEPIVLNTWYFSKLFRDSFHDVFRATFSTPCTDGLKFAEYAVSISVILSRSDFGFVSEVIGGDEKVPSFVFVIVCAMIAELCIFCMERGCYSYLNFASKIFVVVYDKVLCSSFRPGHWECVRDFCETYSPVNAMEPNPSCKIAELYRHSAMESLVSMATVIERTIEKCAFDYHMEKLVLRHQDRVLLLKVKEESYIGIIGDLKCVICKKFCKYSIKRYADEMDADGCERDSKFLRQV